jgi:hypothetical protein
MRQGGFGFFQFSVLNINPYRSVKSPWSFPVPLDLFLFFLVGENKEMLAAATLQIKVRIYFSKK